MGIAVSYHDKAEKLQDFDRLARGPFDRSAWYALLTDHVDQACFLTARNEEGMIVLPLSRTDEGFESLVNWFSFTWRPLAPADPPPRDLMAAAARDLRRRTHRVVLNPVPGEDGIASRTAAAFREAGWMVFVDPCDENHVLRTDGRDFAAYWASRPGRMRTTLQRKGAKVATEVHATFVEAAWKDYREVYEGSWKPEEELADLLEAFARAEGAAGRLRLGVARDEGKPVAAQFWTVEDGTAYIHKLAHLKEAKPLSAGTTLTAAMFAHVIDRDRVALVDFGTGSDEYKRDWMEEVRLRYRITCLDWRKPPAWSQIARAASRRLAHQFALR